MTKTRTEKNLLAVPLELNVLEVQVLGTRDLIMSSYFPDTSEESELVPERSVSKAHPEYVNPKSLQVITEAFSSYNHNDGIIHFPSKRDILWDRLALSPPIYIASEDVVPKLILTGKHVVRLLDVLSPDFKFPADANARDYFPVNAYMHAGRKIPPQLLRVMRFLYRRETTPISVLSFDRNDREDMQLTLPIAKYDALIPHLE